jgi:hypothetical protein
MPLFCGLFWPLLDMPKEPEEKGLRMLKLENIGVNEEIRTTISKKI